MAFEQISLAQYNKAISILDNRIATLEKAYTALAELKKIRREFIDLYNQGDHVAIDYSEWQEDLNSVSTKANTVKDEIVAAEEDFNYIDAICYYCETNNIEVESVSKLISKPLKERLKWDATRLNFMKPTSRAKLPL